MRNDGKLTTSSNKTFGTAIRRRSSSTADAYVYTFTGQREFSVAINMLAYLRDQRLRHEISRSDVWLPVPE